MVPIVEVRTSKSRDTSSRRKESGNPLIKFLLGDRTEIAAGPEETKRIRKELEISGGGHGNVKDDAKFRLLFRIIDRDSRHVDGIAHAKVLGSERERNANLVYALDARIIDIRELGKAGLQR